MRIHITCCTYQLPGARRKGSWLSHEGCSPQPRRNTGSNSSSSSSSSRRHPNPHINSKPTQLGALKIHIHSKSTRPVINKLAHKAHKNSLTRLQAYVFAHKRLCSLTSLRIHSQAYAFAHKHTYSLTGIFTYCVHLRAFVSDSQAPVFAHKRLYSLTSACMNSQAPV